MRAALSLFISAMIVNLGLTYGDRLTANIYAKPKACAEFCNEKNRIHKRENFAPKSRIVEVMLQTPMFPYNRSEPDIFAAFRDKYELPKEFKGPLKEYDFIVVGAGSAGSVLAARLSEGGKASVLLLEAGLGESMLTSVPALAPLFQRTSSVWPYLMEPQPNVCLGIPTDNMHSLEVTTVAYTNISAGRIVSTGMDNGQCFWPRGRAVGGTSVVNYMIYTRGMKEDWDRISAKGNYGWSYDDVMKYYMKSERAHLKEFQKSPWHSKDGELNVEDVPFRSKLSKAFLDAGTLLGNRRVDYNSPDGFGFAYIQATVNRGVRMSSAKAFLHNNKKRKNLHILTNSRVTKLMIESTTKTATGVEFLKNGQRYEIRAKKEVILSAGPIESPHLLMLSGIGPRKHLESLGIEVVQDLQVGATLYDHISFTGLAFILNTTRLTLLEARVATLDNILQYTQFGDGPLSSLAGVETLGYIKTNVSEEIGNFPDIELIGSCASLASDDGKIVAKGVRLADWLYNDVYKPIENMETFTILLMLLHPKSKGYMRLRSKNPFEQPKLYGNYLTHPKDVATMVAGIRYVLKMIDTPPFQKYGTILHKKKFPNCRMYKFGSDGYWECAIRTITATLHHQISTCKMGPPSDPSAVVDPELRVYGINNLRVVDTSIIPNTIAAHTNAPGIMIGEKGADMVKQTWGL